MERASENSQYGEAWKIVNEISGRKKTKSGQIEGATAENRMKNWHKHCRLLLGNPPTVDENKEIPSVYTDLSIGDPFIEK